MVEGGSCRACAASSGTPGAATSSAGAATAATHVRVTRKTAKAGSPVPLLLGGGGLLSLLVLVLVYVFLWSGAGGVVSAPRVQIYFGDLAKLQLDVQQASRELLSVKAVLPDLDPGVVAPALEAAKVIENAAVEWQGRESPSTELAADHAALLAGLQGLSAAAVSLRAGLQSGNPSVLYQTMAAFELRQTEFSMAASRLMTKGASGS